MNTVARLVDELAKRGVEVSFNDLNDAIVDADTELRDRPASRNRNRGPVREGSEY